ncbi:MULTISPECIES: hypothetical protein [unclassified Microbacterium]|uniref:hypothetical protein n=1 Tax=unclassified Microbacterium TaxID=2609290 RepID=UPI00109D4897|nr:MULTISPECIES: hypothetical protein [unclassified Microbacterium]
MTDNEFPSHFDANEIIRKATRRIADQTESALRVAVAAELRRQGWTVVPPGEAHTPTESSTEHQKHAQARRDETMTLISHTPTDDEREALATLLDELHGPWVTEGGCDFRGWRYGWRPGDAPRVNVDVIDPILSALRRTEVPEPRPTGGSEFPTTDEVRDIWVDHMSLIPDDVPAMQEVFDSWLGRTLKEAGRESSAETVKTVPEPQGEPSEHRDRIALAEFIDKALDGDAGYGVGEFLAGGILSFLSERAALHAAFEPKGEPSDAQVQAAARSWVTNGGVATWDNAAPHVRDNAIRRMREALRAAGVGGVR